MKSKYLRASFTCPGAAQEENRDLVANAELCQNPGFRHNRAPKDGFSAVRHLYFSGVEIFLLSSSNREVSGGPVGRSLCHAAIHEL
jgi:hypothetical protein